MIDDCALRNSTPIHCWSTAAEAAETDSWEAGQWSRQRQLVVTLLKYWVFGQAQIWRPVPCGLPPWSSVPPLRGPYLDQCPTIVRTLFQEPVLLKWTESTRTQFLWIHSGLNYLGSGGFSDSVHTLQNEDKAQISLTFFRR